MFIFWSSHNQDSIRMGAFVDRCRLCDQEQAFALFHVSQTDRIYGIKLAKTVVNKFVACEVCGDTFSIPKKTNVPVIYNWRIADGLNSLANRLDYQLDHDHIEMVNRQSITALLRRIASTNASLNIAIPFKNFVSAALFGTVGGAILAALALSGYPVAPTDTFINGITGFIGSFIPGLIGITIRDLVRFNNTKRAIELVFYMDKLKLSLEEVNRVADGLPSKDSKVKALVETLYQQVDFKSNHPPKKNLY